MNIAEKLKKLREEKGITQVELIKELEKEQNISIAISSIKNYENVKSPRIPQGDILLALARYYDVTLESLIDNELEPLKKDNIDIGKELKINNDTIDNIKFLNEINIMSTFNDFCTSDIFCNFFDYLDSYNKLRLFNYRFFLINQLPLSQTSFDYMIEAVNGYKYTQPHITLSQNLKHYFSEKEEKDYIDKYGYNLEKITKNKKQQKEVFTEYLGLLEDLEKERKSFTFIITESILSENEYLQYKELLIKIINHNLETNIYDMEEEEQYLLEIKHIILFFNQLYYLTLTNQDLLELKINKLLSMYLKEL